MKRSNRPRHLFIGGLLIGLGCVTGQQCPTPPTPAPPDVPPAITGLGVNGTLIQDQASDVEVQATVTDEDGVAAVTANLLRIGGSQAQPLVLGDNNLWTFNGTVTPPNSGQQRVTVLATDETGSSSQAVASINVATSQPTQEGPLVSNPEIVGTLKVALASTIQVTTTVTPQTGTTIVSVVADLSAIGGPSNAQMVPTGTGAYFFSGPVIPSQSGVQSVSVEATDNLGNATAASTTVLVQTGGIG